jgi:hypothetical protein
MASIVVGPGDPGKRGDSTAHRFVIRSPLATLAGMPGDDRVTQTSAYLRMLLLRPGEQRTAWERLAGPTTAAEIDYPAVAKVLSAGGPLVGDGVVRDALEGTALSGHLLDEFVRAFAIRPRQASRLAELLRGSAAVRAVTGALLPPADLPGAGGPPGYQTLSLHELHRLGASGIPAEHQTIQVIRSTVDGLGSVPYRFDTDELVVEVVRGGRVGDRVHRVSDLLHAIDLVLAEPLAPGATALLQYHCTFGYRSAPLPEFRRGILGAVNDLTMWVVFDAARLPRRVWRARWRGLDGTEIEEQEPIDLDDEHTVNHRFGAVERAVVGFFWEW